MTASQLTAFSATDRRGAAAVELASQPSLWVRTGSSYRVHGYRVSAAHCSCPAYRYSSDSCCKHSIAALLLDELANQEAAF